MASAAVASPRPTRRPRTRQAAAGGEADEADACGVEMPRGGMRPHEPYRALAILRARVVVVARREAIGENERRDAPVVVDLGDVGAFAAVHQHDVAATGRDDDGAAIRGAGDVAEITLVREGKEKALATECIS